MFTRKISICSNCNNSILGSKFACPHEGCRSLKCRVCKDLPFSKGGGFSCSDHERSPSSVIEVGDSVKDDEVLIVGSIVIPTDDDTYQVNSDASAPKDVIWNDEVITLLYLFLSLQNN